MSFKAWLKDLIIKALDAYQKYKNKPTPAPTPVPVPIPTPNPNPDPITPSNVRTTPPGVTQAYMDGNGSWEECDIEPHTGLMIRIAVWCYNDRQDRWGWWLLSSAGEGHVSRQGNNLVFADYVLNGVQYVCRGWTNYEPQYTEANPTLYATGNTCPYDGSRRYAIIDCWKAPAPTRSGFVLIFDTLIIAAAITIVGGLAHRIHKQNHVAPAPLEVKR